MLLLDILVWIVIIDVVFSWLIGFNVINRANQAVRTITDFTARVTQPLLQPIRNVISPIGGLDLSPIVLLIGIMFLRRVIFYIF